MWEHAARRPGYSVCPVCQTPILNMLTRALSTAPPRSPGGRVTSWYSLKAVLRGAGPDSNLPPSPQDRQGEGGSCVPEWYVISALAVRGLSN